MAKLIDVKYGSTRTVVLIGRYALKFPTTYSYKLFLCGLLGNLNERQFSQMKDARLCPILFSVPLGLLNVMPRTEPISRELFYSADWKEFRERKNSELCLIELVEVKLDSFGLLNGEIVVVDYGGS